MSLRPLGLALLLTLALAGCDQPAPAPPPVEITADAVGHYCGMMLDGHGGPKGQALVQGQARPFWFSSARDALVFTRMPEEPRAIAAVYVTDMGRAQSWEQPGPGAWVEIHAAWFVLGSDRQAGMGGAEAVPFAREDQAAAFVAAHGGRAVRLAEVPDDYLFESATPEEGGHASH